MTWINAVSTRFRLSLASEQDGGEQFATTDNFVSPATAGGVGGNQLFRGDRTIVHRGGTHESLAAIKAEANRTIWIGGGARFVHRDGSGWCCTDQGAIRGTGQSEGNAAWQVAVVRFKNARFEIGIPGLSVLVLMARRQRIWACCPSTRRRAMCGRLTEPNRT